MNDFNWAGVVDDRKFNQSTLEALTQKVEAAPERTIKMERVINHFCLWVYPSPSLDLSLSLSRVLSLFVVLTYSVCLFLFISLYLCRCLSPCLSLSVSCSRHIRLQREGGRRDGLQRPADLAAEGQHRSSSSSCST